MQPPKVSKESVGYTDQAKMPTQRCKFCAHYVNPTTCYLVQGRINPNGWCKRFTGKEGK